MSDRLLTKHAEAFVGAHKALESERTYPHTPNALMASHVWRGVLLGYSTWRGHQFASYVQDHPESLNGLAIEPGDTFQPLQLAKLICSQSVSPEGQTGKSQG